MAKTVALHLPGDMGIIVFGVLAGTALYTLFKLAMTLVRVYTFRLSLTKSVVCDDTLTSLLRRNNLEGKVFLLENTKPFAYCFGFRRPKIFLSSGLLAVVNKKELEIILRHEKYHLEHQDNFILLFARIVESFFPFLPILTDLIRMYKTDRELLADRAAIQKKEDKNILTSILKKLLQYEPVSTPSFAPAIADADTLETRIKVLCSIPVRHYKLERKNIYSSLIFAIMLVALMSTPVNAVELHKNGIDAMIVCNENVSCESMCSDRTLLKLQNNSSISSPKFSSSNN
ncbi:MAG: M56 family metallopeptidase [Candidatus Woesebacteria bacterium]